MTYARTTIKDAAVGVAIAENAKELSALRKPGCAAAIWHRQVPRGFQSWLDGLAPEHLPNGRCVLRAGTVADGVTRLCDIARTPDCAERAQLINDVAALAGVFAGLMPSPYLRLRLQAVQTNACRKFHIDALTARLICTYRGTGTHYGISTDGNDPKPVFSVPTGSPIVLRGTHWPEHPPSGLLHRSPPIEGTNETRLVLVLDPVSDPEDTP